jgi:integration host factor subunit beta
MPSNGVTHFPNQHDSLTNTPMTRSDLILKLAEQHPQYMAKDIELAVKCIFDSMTSTLAKGGRIEIRDFGSLGLNYRPPRKGRNPKTGEPINIPGKYLPHFKMGKELRERVDELHALA